MNRWKHFTSGAGPPSGSIACGRRRWRRQHQRLAEFDDLGDAPIVDHLETHHFSDVEVGPHLPWAMDQMVDPFEGDLEEIVFVIIGNTPVNDEPAAPISDGGLVERLPLPAKTP
jgi:hypothetical protein